MLVVHVLVLVRVLLVLVLRLSTDCLKLGNLILHVIEERLQNGRLLLVVVGGGGGGSLLIGLHLFKGYFFFFFGLTWGQWRGLLRIE